MVERQFLMEIEAGSELILTREIVKEGKGWRVARTKRSIDVVAARKLIPEGFYCKPEESQTDYRVVEWWLPIEEEKA